LDGKSLIGINPICVSAEGHVMPCCTIAGEGKKEGWIARKQRVYNGGYSAAIHWSQ